MCILKGGIVLPKNPNLRTLANPNRFRTIMDLTQMRPDCGASIDDIFVIDNEFLLIVDIAYIGGILNPYNNPSASYVRTHGVMVHGPSRSEHCPVFWGDPFLLLPLSYHLRGNFMDYQDIGTVVGRVFCSTGSFLMMPIREDILSPLDSLMDEALSKKTGAQIKIPSGTYRVFYEQFDVPEGAKKESYQNIAVQKQ